MRKFILLLSAVGVLNFASGQDHQISIGAGLFSSNIAINTLSSIGKNISGSIFNGSTLTNSEQYGEFRASYSYSPINWLSTGATFSFARSTHDHAKNNVIIGNQTVDFYTFAGEVTFFYLKRDHVRLYGLIGAGATAAKQEDEMLNSNQTEYRKYNYLNFQLSPIGLETGSENFGGFFELGFGYRGIMSIGAFFRL